MIVFRGDWSRLLALTALFAECPAQQRGSKELQLAVGVMQKEIRGGNGPDGCSPCAGLAEPSSRRTAQGGLRLPNRSKELPFTKELVLNFQKTCNYLQFAQKPGN